MKSKWNLAACLVLAVVAALCPAMAADQASPAATWAARAVSQYLVMADVTYLKIDNFEAKADVYRRRDATGPLPTLIYIHGGGWIGGSKGGTVNHILPWLEMGWNVVSLDYRLARVSPAPAAVEDCLCALRWVATRAQAYGIDMNRLVVSGDSAGGQLALTTGMIPESAGLDRQCPGAPLPKVAAIVNFYGITDVADLLDGPNQKSYAVSWLANSENRLETAKRVSPLTYVRPGVPPVLTVQGDADPTVPYTHAVRLHEALGKANVANQLVTVPGGRHGMFTADEYARAYSEIRAFLAKQDLLPK